MIKKTSFPSKSQPTPTSYQRPHDQWQEVVVQAGGTDDDQGKVVRKSRSIRWQRWMFTVSVTAFTFGALMIGFATPSIRNEIIAPGELCSSHAQILAGQGVDRCAACHPGGDQSFSQWVSTAAFGANAELPTQSELCMKCHEQSFDKQWAMSPHNVDPEVLSSKLNSELNAKPESFVARLDGLTRLPSPTHSGEIACGVCHREHHGSKNDLTALTDQQCQVCHQNVYHSFESDHPSLGNYPLNRRSRIAFDHNSHATKHYANAKQAFECAQCHVTDSRNNVQVLASFEQTCAECHQQKIAVLSEPGLTLLALPTLDMTAIESQGTNVGSWPLAAIGDFDGVMPPLMRMLLLADLQAKEVLLQRGDQFDFSDLNPEVPQDIADGVTLVWSIKRLVFELARDGRFAISRRIKEVTGVELRPQQLNALTNSLEANVFQNSANRWLPDLQDEVSSQVPTYEVSLSLMRSAVTELQSQVPQDFVWKNDSTAALARVFGELARQDEVLQTQPPRDNSNWLAVNPLAGMAKQPVGEINASKQVRVDADQRTKPALKQPKQSISLRTNAHEASGSFVMQQDDREDSEWLADNPLANQSGLSSSDASAKLPIQELPIQELPNQESLALGESAAALSASAPGTDSALAPPSHTPSVWNRGETVPIGWVRDDLRFQLRYQPTGHADETVKNWIDFAGQVPSVGIEAHAGPLFELLLASDGFGDCRRCHTADEQPSGQLSVNWEPEYRDPAVAVFTKFSHGPHLTLPQLRDCSQCHQLDQGKSNQRSFAGFDPNQFQSNFVALTTSDCAACHRAGGASNSCTQCHNYHIGKQRVQLNSRSSLDAIVVDEATSP